MHPDVTAVKEAALSVMFLFPVAGREYSRFMCTDGMIECKLREASKSFD